MQYFEDIQASTQTFIIYTGIKNVNLRDITENVNFSEESGISRDNLSKKEKSPIVLLLSIALSRKI